MSAAPLNTEAARRTYQRRSHPILLSLAHTTRRSLCLNPDRSPLVCVAKTSLGCRTGVGRLEASVLAQVEAYLFTLLIYWSL